MEDNKIVKIWIERGFGRGLNSLTAFYLSILFVPQYQQNFFGARCNIIVCGIAPLSASAIPPTPTHFSIAWSLSLSPVVSHICSPDLDAIWRYTCGVQWLTVSDKNLRSFRGGEIMLVKPQTQTFGCFRLTIKRWFMIHQVAARIGDFAAYQIL